jgi:hypothetical protein
MVDLILLQVVFDKRKQLIEYVGTACATDLRRTSLPALLASRPLQGPTRPFILDVRDVIHETPPLYGMISSQRLHLRAKEFTFE